MAAGDTRFEYALASTSGSTLAGASTALDAMGTSALQAMVNALHAALPAARVVSAQRWQSSVGTVPSRVHLVIVGPPTLQGTQAAVRAALPAAVNSAITSGGISLSPNVVQSAYEGPMGSPGAGWSQVATASWSAPSGGGTTTTPPANYDRCAMGASPEAFTAYRDEWGTLSGSNAVTVPALTTLKVLGRARRTISGPSDNRLLQIELLRGALAGQKVWVVSSPESTQALRNNGCAAVDTFAADSRPNPTGGSQGSTSNPTPAPPPAPLPAVIPAQASAGGDLAMWIVFGSLAGAGYLVWDKMKRRGRRSRG